MQARSGFTLPEVLFAMLIGSFVLFLTIQQVTEYFRLQQVLVVRTELRHQVQQTQERVAQKLRYADRLYPVADGYFLTVPRDTCADGYLCTKDEYEVIWWRVAPDALDATRKTFTERTITLPAFRQPVDPTIFERLFEGELVAPARQVAYRLDTLEITQAGTGTFRTRVGAGQTVPRQDTPVTVALVETVAQRSLPNTESLPSLDERLEDYKWKP